MSLLRYFTSCMSRSKGPVNGNDFKNKYDNEILDIFYADNIPQSIKELLIYIAREGVAVTDLFRRPGNTQHIKRVMRQLKSGEDIDWAKYNFYTLANIAKRYLLQIHHGILGESIEHQLIDTLDLSDDQTRIESMSRILKSLSRDVLQLLALLFGTWFRMIYHSEVNAMSVEAVAKSVAGSVFPSCTVNPNQVNKASKVMEYLITGFASSELFGRELIEYFTQETKTSISRIEKFKYEFIYPKNVSKKNSTRLFVRMLLEESSKHGFDLLKDEVSREQFMSVDDYCTIGMNGDGTNDNYNGSKREKESLSNSISSNAMSSVDEYCDDSRDIVKTRKRRRLSKTVKDPIAPKTLVADDLKIISDTGVGHRSNYLYHNSNDDHQVQQTFEKRTCVVASSADNGRVMTTATMLTKGIDCGFGTGLISGLVVKADTTAMANHDEYNNHYQPNNTYGGNQYKYNKTIVKPDKVICNDEVEDRDPLLFNQQYREVTPDSSTSPSLTETGTDYYYYHCCKTENRRLQEEIILSRNEKENNPLMDDIIKSEIRKRQKEFQCDEVNCVTQVPQDGGLFSRVKRQQLERLQKRSDWFLSPPSGCRSDGLMQLNPAPATFQRSPLSVSSDYCCNLVATGNDVADCHGRDGGKLDFSKNGDDFVSNNGNIINDEHFKSINSTNISLSDPILFHSSNCAAAATNPIQYNDVDDPMATSTDSHSAAHLSDEEDVIEVRYFVVRKYYGGATLRFNQCEE